MSEIHTPIEKLMIVLEGLKPNKRIEDICRQYHVEEKTYYQWRDCFLSGALNELTKNNA